jgi:exopolysaccharide production protein ExoZ
MIENIQILRAFAAINVVLFHIILTSSTYNQTTNLLLLFGNFGLSGVDIFFVISGFIITYAQSVNKKKISEFLVLRFIRIVPLYWFLTFVFSIIFFFFSSYFRERTISLELFFYSIFFISNISLTVHPVIIPGWTLEYEMIFYLLFSISLFIKKLKFKFIYLFIIISFIAFVLKEFKMLEFLFGVICAFIYLNYYINKKNSFILLTVSIFFFLITIFNKGFLYNYLIWGLSSFLLFLSLIYLPQIKSKIFIFLGNASYSIYLIQFFTIPIFYKLSSKFLLILNSDIVALLCLLFSVIIGCLIHLFIEKPLIYISKKNFNYLIIK